jgi:hypothetical protein
MLALSGQGGQQLGMHITKTAIAHANNVITAAR